MASDVVQGAVDIVDHRLRNLQRPRPSSFLSRDIRFILIDVHTLYSICEVCRGTPSQRYWAGDTKPSLSAFESWVWQLHCITHLSSQSRLYALSTLRETNISIIRRAIECRDNADVRSAIHFQAILIQTYRTFPERLLISLWLELRLKLRLILLWNFKPD